MTAPTNLRGQVEREATTCAMFMKYWSQGTRSSMRRLYQIPGGDSAPPSGQCQRELVLVVRQELVQVGRVGLHRHGSLDGRDLHEAQEPVSAVDLGAGTAQAELKVRQYLVHG